MYIVFIKDSSSKTYNLSGFYWIILDMQNCFILYPLKLIGIGDGQNMCWNAQSSSY